MAGEGLDESNKALANRYGSIIQDKNIKLLGTVEKVYELLQECSVIVCLSRSESFGLVALEGILCGSLVLASNINAFRRIVPKEFIFESENIKKIADLIEKYAGKEKILSSKD